MITREADYAIRAILHLSKVGGDRPVSSLELAKEMDIPYRFMRRIGLKLAKTGFIETRKGKGGGIRLLKEPSKISLLDVLSNFDADGFKLNGCLTDGNPCSRTGHCPVHKEMAKLQGMLDAQLEGLTFDKLLK